MLRRISLLGWARRPCRGMAFAKPVIVTGERGFSAPFNADTADEFYYKGMYGIGNGELGNERLVGDILSVANRRDRFDEIGRFSRNFVVTHFSVEAVSARLEAFCQKAADEVPRWDLAMADGVRTAAVGLGRKLVPDVLWQRLKAQKKAAGEG